MTKPALGVLVGAVLGVLDGLSAWTYPEARSMIISIVISSTVKGIVTGAATGWLARRWKSMAAGIAAGTAIGFVLSAVAAIPVASQQPSRYFDIVLPGMLLGAIVGFVTQRYAGADAKNAGRQMIGRVLLLCLIPASLAAQAPAPPDPFAPIAFMLGRWEGTSEGQPGKGTVRREYSRTLNSRFIRAQNRSEYPPHDKHPKGEIHEHEDWFSFDRARKRIILRQFHVEGFVNTYVQDGDTKPGTIAFTTEAIENIPAGYRARETYVVLSPDEFEEVFELAGPDKAFEVYSRTRLKRLR